MQDGVRNVVIIGSGPAGYTAAIYTARALLHPLVIAGVLPGGQLMLTTEVENFPGFPDGVLGPELMELMKRQAEKFGAEIIYENVVDITLGNPLERVPFKIKTDGGKEFLSWSVIIATGASAKTLGLESEKKLVGRGVSTCATCDGAFYKNKRVIVVGGGDSAMEEATFLTRFASEVIVVHRRDKLRASKIMQERAFKNPKIKFIWNSVVHDILDPAKGKVEKVILKNVQTGSLTEMPIDGIFVAIGHKPNTEFLVGKIEMDEQGYIKVQNGSTRTSYPGIFAAGDVHDSKYRQAITAAGSGCMAALDCQRFLESIGLVD
ncbi:MAG: thioredoxin-disulfide reductase [Candidatus Calescibacterium sp.]|nr:thioredoxin-disulfide reductase [Candidatus Calescibacterium sp.]MDW8087620.1 thioredoxin-disulfide reductase [Candidatus Calescibacterium sp.]